MTTPKDKSQEGPYTADGCVVDGPTCVGIVYASDEEAEEVANDLNAAYAAGQAAQWISVEDRLPPTHEEPYPEDGFVMILFQCGDWPNKYKTMKASRTIGDWAEDGSPLWFWTYEDGEIIDDDDNLITHWMPLPAPPSNP